MPLKLRDPRPGKSPFFTIRGTHRGVYVERSTGTADRREAQRILRECEHDIDGGRLRRTVGPTFASAMIGYLDAGGEARFLSPLLEHFGETALADINQQAIDAAAVTLYPTVTNATRNRQVYTPMQAILRHAGVTIALRRPKGAQGRVRTDWLWPDQAWRLLDACDAVHAEFGLFCRFLLYTGCRRSEPEGLSCDDVVLTEAYARLADTKTAEPRGIHLPPPLVAALANHPAGLDRPGAPLFPGLGTPQTSYSRLYRARAAAGADLGWVTFHTLRHTWATWMRRYGGLDTRGLVGTGAWRDHKSAARYSHVVVAEEARRADLLPTPTRGKSGERAGGIGKTSTGSGG